MANNVGMLVSRKYLILFVLMGCARGCNTLVAGGNIINVVKYTVWVWLDTLYQRQTIWDTHLIWTTRTPPELGLRGACLLLTAEDNSLLFPYCGSNAFR